MSSRSFLVLAAFVSLLSGTATLARAESVVLQASGPSASSFTQGKVLQDSAQITLIQGDSLRLLVSGETRVMFGPYDGQLRAYEAANASGQVWSGTLRPMPRTRAAATRGFRLTVVASNSEEARADLHTMSSAAR